MGDHALLSASSSHRWLHCPPSARLCEAYEDTSSSYAQEGTDAHTLCEFHLKKSLGYPVKDPTEHLSYFNDEMELCAMGYARYVLELVERAKESCQDPLVLIEQRLDFSDYVEGGFGTGDCVIVADGTLHVVDYKHGLGILVDANRNPQMMLYALGAIALFDGLYDVDTVHMTVYQPRRNNISTYTLPKSELLDWAETNLKPNAKQAFCGEGDFCSGDWCHFCKAKHECRERAEANLRLAAEEFQLPPLLTDEEIAPILPKLDHLIAWANDIKSYALQAAIGGKVWAGYKLVEGSANRKYVDEKAVAAAVSDAGFDPYGKKLRGITEMQKVLGKAKFEELLGNYIIRPEGKPTLVPNSDKRQPIDTATQDFMEEI